MAGLSVLLEAPKACPDRILIICRTYALKRPPLSPNGSGNLPNDCLLCTKKLQLGKDIYMYRDRAFCSVECRYRQILTDDDVRRRALAANRRRRRAVARERAIAGCRFVY